ncbi:MAG: PQQ-binding-like beta-propeller repeat protein [Verrucomicrobia bacterium]|nr:PQQ-binding-like beta-propeller repeat protein [Verrucomicrobiota bacterium]
MRIPLILAATLLTVQTHAANWPQFRGPDAASTGNSKVPAHFGPKTNLLWSTELPPGISSPVIWGSRIFLTGVDSGKLVTLALDRASGKVLWTTPAPAEKLEATHRISSPAATTTCTDGERVIAYFGSYGLLAYDFAGKELWRHPLPSPVVEFGAGSSPILVGDLVIQLCDSDMDSFLIAVDKRTGRQAWKAARPTHRRGFATPFLWRHDGIEELIVNGSLKLSSYDPLTGALRWTCRGMARVANASPTAGEGLLFIASWNIGSDASDKLVLPPHAEFLAQHDKSKDGKLAKDEFPTGPFKDRFTQFDLDKDGFVTKAEYEGMADQFVQAENAIFAIKPGGRGDITDTHVVWKHNRSLPYVASPLFHQGRVYSVRSGGMATCLDAKTGEPVYRDERLGALGDYYASLTAADGNLIAVSQKGTVTVFSGSNAPEVLARNEMSETVMSTPALVDGRIYLRTDKRLMCFGK